MVNPKNRKVIIPIILVIVAGLSFIVYQSNDNTESVKTIHTQNTDTDTTSDIESAQSDFSGAEEREAGNTQLENQGTGQISDTGGVPSSDTSNSTTSKTGEITVYLPKKDSVVSVNQEISGKSTLPSVSYRIIDNISGVIAAGELKVVNGNFSGKLNFSTPSSQGRIDIFGTKPDATEFSNIELPVRFK